MYPGDRRFNLGTIKNMIFARCERVEEYEEKQLNVVYKKDHVIFQYDCDGVNLGLEQMVDNARLLDTGE